MYWSATNWNVSVLQVASLMIGLMSVGVWPVSWPAMIVPPLAGVPFLGRVPLTMVPSSALVDDVEEDAARPVFFALPAPVTLTTTAASAATTAIRPSSR